MSFYDRYEYLTRKQANIVYAAIKSGRIHADKKWINEMYNAVGNRFDETANMMVAVQKVVNFICENIDEFAQAVIDGKNVEEKYVVVGTHEVRVTEENIDNYLFYEIGDVVEEEKGEWRWVID